jgi:type I restriction enzyme S subunit
MKPKGWIHCRFEELFRLKHGFAFPSEGYSDQGTHFLVTPGNFFEQGGFRHRGSDEKFFVGPIPADYVLKDDDVLVVMTEQAEGLLGSAAYVPATNSYLHNQRLGRVVDLDSRRLSKNYLCFLFNSLPVRRQISVTASGTKVRHTSPDKIGEVEVCLPTLPEQQKIADILGTWDEALEKLNALIAAKERRKQALMQQLLSGQRRLPRFKDKWKPRRFSEILMESRVSVTKNDPTRRITVCLHLNGVEARAIRTTGSADATIYYERRAGQFIYGKQNIHKGALGLVPESLDRYHSTQDVPSFDFKAGYDRRWFYHLVARPQFYEQLEPLMKGTGSKRLAPEIFLDLEARTPAPDEQAAIADVLDAADAELRLLRQQRAALDQQKRGLMQQLLTGRIRVQTST